MEIDLGKMYRDSFISGKFTELGMEKVYEDCTNIDLARYYIGGSYEEWLEKAVPFVPSWMSRDEFMERYVDRLRSEYDKQLAMYGMSKGEEGE